MNGEQRYCQHANCRLDTAVELAFAGSVLVRKDLLVLAGQVNQATVRCRMQPRRGAVMAPFPPRKEVA